MKIQHFVLFVLVLALVSQPSFATHYSVQALWTSEGSDAAMYQQWLSSAKLAATTASASWSSDTLSIDLVECKSNPILRIQNAVAATQNSSVHAVLAEADDSSILAAITSSVSMPVVSPNTIFSEVNTEGLGMYTLLPKDGARVDALRAVLTKYGWTKVGVLFSEVNQGVDVKLIRMLPGLDIHEYGLDPLASSYVEQLDELYRLSINVAIVVDPEGTVAQRLFAEAVQLQLLAAGRAWIFLNDQPSLPTWAPQGTLVIHEVDATPANLTLFRDLVHAQDPLLYPGMGPASPIFGGSLLVYDTVLAISEALQRGFPSIITRSMLNNSLSQLSIWGYSGMIDFNSDGFRKTGHVQILTASNVSGVYDLSMAYEHSLTTIQEPLWPGHTTVVPDDQIDNIPIVLMLDFSGGHSTPFDTEALYAAMKYAVYRLNDIPGFLPPSKKVCPVLLDDETKPSMAVLRSINVPHLGAAGVVGGMSSSISIVVQDVISAWNIPQISPSATAPQLSNKDVYPTFSRVCSSADIEADIVVAMSKLYGWTELSIISTLDAYGSAAAQDLLTHAADSGISIHEHLVVDPYLHAYDEPLKRMVAANPRVLVLLVGVESINNVILSMHRVGLNPPATISADSIALTNITEFAHEVGVPDSYFSGWVIFGQPGGTGQKFDDFMLELKGLDTSLWPGVSRITGSSPMIVSCFDAVTVMVDSIKRCVESSCDPRNGTEMLPFVRSVDLVGLTGHITLDEAGDRSGTFDVRNVKSNMQNTIGRFSYEEGLHLYEQVVWPDGTTNVPLAVIPREQIWLKWSSVAGIVISIVAAMGIGLSIFMMLVIYWQKESPVILTATWPFLILMCCGAIVGFSSVWVWIGRPQPYLCILRMWIPPLAFVIMLSPLLAKTWRLMRIFSLSTFKVEPIPISALVIIVSALTSVQIIISIVWTILGSSKVVIVNDIHNPKYAFVTCEHTKANKIASYVTYAYNGLLILIGCYLAFKVRKLPKDFNESLWIVRAIYNTLLFAGLIIILGYSLSTWISTVTILICVCTLGICFGSIGLIMAPKIWELYVHPERRSSAGSSGDSTHQTSFSRRNFVSNRTRTTSRTKSKSASDVNSKDAEKATNSVPLDDKSSRRKSDYSRRSRPVSKDPVSEDTSDETSEATQESTMN